MRWRLLQTRRKRILPWGYFSIGVSADTLRHWRNLSATLELQPNNALGRQYCAWVRRRRGEWDRSIADAQRAEELDPRDATIPMNLGITYALLRQWKDAKQVQVRALAMDPHNVIAAMILAMTQLNSAGDIDSARRAFDGIPPEPPDQFPVSSWRRYRRRRGARLP